MRYAVFSADDTTRERARYVEVGKTFVVGSAPDCDIVVDDPEVAARHVRISELKSTANFVEIEPFAPTIVDGNVLPDARWLPSEAPIRIGQTIVLRAQGSVVRIREHWGATFRGTSNPPPPRGPIPPPPPPVRHAIIADDPVETRMLATLRDHPGDEATRAIYGDWLEQRGNMPAAAFVRDRDLDVSEVLAATTVAFRVITSRSCITRCWYESCPQRWHLLTPKPDDDYVRDCPECTRPIRFIAGGNTEDAFHSTHRGESYVLDLEAYRRK